MGSWAVFNPPLNQPSNYFTPSVIWNNRAVQVICAAVCLPLLYLLVTRILALFKPHPASVPPKDLTFSCFQEDNHPDDPCLKVFKYTTLSDRRALAQTCKRFNLLTQNTAYLTHILSTESDAQEKTVTKFLEIFISLPRSIVFPELNEPMIPVIQKLLESLEEKIQDPLKYHWDLLSLELVLLLRKPLYPPLSSPFNVQNAFPNWSPDALPVLDDIKLLYNFPDILLLPYTLADFQEISRRYGLNQWSGKGDAMLKSRFDDIESIFFWGEGTQMLLTGISCEFLKHLLNKFGNKTWFSDEMVKAFLNMKNQKDTSQKLCIFADYYKEHAHEWSQEDDILVKLLFPAMHLHNLNLLDTQTIIHWLPPSWAEITWVKSRLTRTTLSLKYGTYTIQDLFVFLESVLEDRPPYITDLYFTSYNNLEETLNQYGSGLRFTPSLVLHFTMTINRQEAYQKVSLLGARYQQYYREWRPETRAYNLYTLLFSAMHVLSYKSPNLSPAIDSRISLKNPLLAWIPPEYLNREQMERIIDRHLKLYLKIESSSYAPYNVQDLIAFLEELSKEV